jgi:integrase/recombinase XerD
MNKAQNKPGRPPNKAQPARSLTASEVHNLFGVCIGKQGLRNRALLSVLFYSGARIGTALQLNCEQLADSNGKCRSSFVVQKSNEKSKRTHRYYIAKPGQKIIQDYLNSIELSNGFPVFPSPFTGKHITPSSGSTLIKNLLLKANITDTSSHSGRKTFLTSLYLNSGIGILELMKIANHSHPSQTIKYINNLTPNIHKAMDHFKY